METSTKYDLHKPQINWFNKIQASDEQLLGANLPGFVMHPWGMIDYHLYLSFIERKRNCEARLNESHLLTTDGLQQITFNELWDLSTFKRVPRGTHPIIVFVMLPVPASPVDLVNRKLVLGFDLKNHHLLAWLFDDAPGSIADLSGVWEQRQMVIDLDVYRFLEILDYTMNGHMDILRVGMLGYFQESTREYQSTLDLVIVVQFVQFLNDFVDLLGIDSDEFLACVQPYEEKLRELICTASRNAWAGASSGESIQRYRRRRMDDHVLFDLIQEPSLSANHVRHLSPGFVRSQWRVPRSLQLPSPRLVLLMLVMGICLSITTCK